MKAFLSLLGLPALLAGCAQPAQVRPPSAAILRVSAAVAAQVRRCYRAPRIPSAGRSIVTRILVRYGPDGRLVGLPLLVSQQGVTLESRPYAGRMTEAASLAAIRCNPIRLPAQLGKRRSNDFYLTFSPRRQA